MQRTLNLSEVSRPVRRAVPWLGLIVTAGLPRFLGAFFFANQDRDAYAYVNEIAELRASMAAGTFSLKDLSGFWLPMYQTVCAAGSLLVNNPLYVAKVVSAICGTATCLLVFLICRHVTDRRDLAYAAFALIAFNPLHIMYSSFSMTEAPYIFLVAGSLLFTIEDRSMLAAIFALLAGLMRVEAWMLIILIPALRVLAGRKVKPASCIVPALAPLICFYIYWAATGDPFDYFHSRAVFIRGFLVDRPELKGFSGRRIISDAGRLLYSVNPLVFIASVAGASLTVKDLRAKGRSGGMQTSFAVGAACVFFFSFLGFLLAAYFTNNQPEIWTRYGLLFFVLGIPILIWASAALPARLPRWRRWIAAVTIGGCLAQWGIQLHYGILYVSAVGP